LKEAFNRSDVGVLLKIPRAENNRLERAVGKSRCSVYLSDNPRPLVFCENGLTLRLAISLLLWEIFFHPV